MTGSTESDVFVIRTEHVHMYLHQERLVGVGGPVEKEGGQMLLMR